MPLSNIVNGTARQCSAKNRKTGSRCLNLAAFGMITCRYHGARKRTTVLRGTEHPQYQHGMETLDAKRQRREALEEIANYEIILRALGLLEK